MLKDKLGEILNFFSPIRLKDFEDSSFLNDEHSVGSNLVINSIVNPLPLNSRFEIALIFVDGFLVDAERSTQIIREEVYRLKKISGLRVVDLGNLKTGIKINETVFALQEVCALLYQLKINTVVVGGSQMLTIGNFRAFKEFENNINLTNISANLNFSIKKEYTEIDYLNRIIKEESANLYNIANVGYQSYFVDSKQVSRLTELYFENYRLGKVRRNIENIEPVFRDSDLVSLGINSIRMTDAPGQIDGSPNGFYAEEVCQLTRYAGISDRVQSFGIYDYCAKHDKQRQTAKLCAQMIWYYLEGFINRKREYISGNLNDYIKYEVQIDEIDFPIVFYKSEKSGRWWLEVIATVGDGDDDRSLIVSCSESDYKQACKNEIPERWWINFKKLR